MSGEHQPWWASATGAEHLDEVDPVEAFRAARRPAGPRPEDASRTGDRSGEPGPARSEGGQDDAAPGQDQVSGGKHRPELCGICPLCTLARNLEETRPELLEHLTEAARHLSAAARALVEPPPPAPRAEQDGDAPAAHDTRSRRARSGVERIPLDQDPGPRPPRASTDTTQERGDG